MVRSCVGASRAQRPANQGARGATRPRDRHPYRRYRLHRPHRARPRPASPGLPVHLGVHAERSDEPGAEGAVLAAPGAVDRREPVGGGGQHCRPAEQPATRNKGVCAAAVFACGDHLALRLDHGPGRHPRCSGGVDRRQRQLRWHHRLLVSVRRAGFDLLADPAEGLLLRRRPCRPGGAGSGSRAAESAGTDGRRPVRHGDHRRG